MTEKPTTIKSIAIVEDNTAVANAFQYFIDDTKRYMVSQLFEDAESAVKTLIKNPVDLILMDIALPGMNGIEATAKIKSACPDTDILIISVSTSPDNVFEALRVGATGYLTKNIDGEDLIDAIDQVVAGGAPMSAQIAKLVVASFQINRKSPLSDRETEVLSLLSVGKSYSVIADELFLAKETVKSHIKNIYSKLHVNSKAEAIEKARRDRLV
ncbi:MAG: response regulator [Bacteroidia bacterium]